MTFFVDDSGLMVTQTLYKTAALIAVLRWVLAWILRYRDGSRHSSSSCPLISPEMIKQSLALASFGDLAERTPWISDTCAVCLGQMEDEDEVRELSNCCHVFHRDCIDRWVDHDDDDHDDGNHRTCPLCRTPLLAAATASQSLDWDWPKNDPSWAVQRLLYLFGDDLLA